MHVRSELNARVASLLSGWTKALSFPVCRALFVLHRHREMQIGLTADEKQQLEGVTLQQLLAAFKAESFMFSRGSSAYRGVCFSKSTQRFRASIRVSSKLVNLGSYVNEEEAARVYDRAAIKHHGRSSLLSNLHNGSRLSLA